MGKVNLSSNLKRKRTVLDRSGSPIVEVVYHEKDADRFEKAKIINEALKNS
jgi:hypothetical protein